MAFIILNQMEEKLKLWIQQLVKDSVNEMAQEATSQVINNPQKEDVLLTTAEVSRRVKISVSTLYRHRALGWISPSHYVGRSPRYTEEDVQRYINLFVVK